MTGTPHLPDWSPFQLAEPHTKPRAPRSMQSREGVGDRLRTTAFAELQAREAFIWASHFFSASAPPGLCQDWLRLAQEEDKHLNWLLNRMKELDISITERPVTLFLWESFMKCKTAREFAIFMSNAEERGRIAGERFGKEMASFDAASSKIFETIAQEEVEHIRLAYRYFPDANSSSIP